MKAYQVRLLRISIFASTLLAIVLLVTAIASGELIAAQYTAPTPQLSQPWYVVGKNCATPALLVQIGRLRINLCWPR